MIVGQIIGIDKQLGYDRFMMECEQLEQLGCEILTDEYPEFYWIKIVAIHSEER